MLTLKQYTNNEMQLLYDFLCTKNVNNEEEIEKAKEQKNILNQHIFDVLSARSKITYGDISQALKELIYTIKDKKRSVFLDKTSIDVFASKDGFYISDNDGEKIYVDISFMVKGKDLQDKDALPLVIVPKDSYFNLQTKKTHFKDDGSHDFSMYDIVKDAILSGASDIHFNFGKELYHVYFRVNNIGIKKDLYTMNMRKASAFFNKVRQKTSLDTAQGFKASEYKLPQGGILRYADLGVDLRVEFSPSGLDDRNKLVCRILKKPTGKLGTIDDLQGYDEHFIKMLRMATKYAKGLMLVTGVTNSGKSTLTSHFINSIPLTKLISTFEDPIEYDKGRPNTTQHQVFISDDDRISIDFLDYVKSSKRQDLDVVEIGEIREGEGGKNDLMNAVVKGVKAGNFTISTTHIDSAFDVPLALVNMYDVDRYVVADLLVFVITQNLVEKLCSHCRIEDTNNTNRSILNEWLQRGDVKYAFTKDLDDFVKGSTLSYIRNPNGCPHCEFKGVKGLVPMYEYYKPDVKMIMWLNENLSTINKFDIEKNFCERENPYLAKNMLSCFIDKLLLGEVDAHENILGRVLMS